MDTDSKFRGKPAAIDALHRLRSALAKLRGELELLELDGRPPGRDVFIAVDEAFDWLSRAEVAALGAPVRVLLADDDGRLAELTATRLRRFGFDVQAVAELSSVVSRLRDGDRVVVDYGLIADAPRSEVERIAGAGRMVVVSGSVAEADRIRALEMGAVAYLVKPVEIEDLARLLRAPAEGQQ
jgi:CheY-like chemotaxis protein